MAAQLGDGAMLHPVGVGVSAIDAAHVTVEFIHPVIVGKRALPALTLTPAEIRTARPGSVILGLDDSPPVVEALQAARTAGCLTVALTPTTVPDVDHQLALGADDDRLLARELQVSAYHLLWETVHEYLDGASSTTEAAPEGLGALYPFLYEETVRTGTLTTAHVEASTRAKAADIGELRDRVLRERADDLLALAATVHDRCAQGGTVWVFGNGGSSTDAQALAHLLGQPSSSGDSTAPGLPLAAHALTDDVATITALANDVSFDVTFPRMLRSLARPGDVAVGLSTSGGSTNVLAALSAAHDQGVTTAGFAGYDGGDMARLDGLDHLLVAPSASVHRIQEAQTTLLHVLVELVRQAA